MKGEGKIIGEMPLKRNLKSYNTADSHLHLGQDKLLQDSIILFM